MVRLWPFAALDDFELHIVAFFQAFISVILDGTVVNEYICTVFAPDKAVAFRVVKPLHLAV